jgi:hypothetical protein
MRLPPLLLLLQQSLCKIVIGAYHDVVFFVFAFVMHLWNTVHRAE